MIKEESLGLADRLVVAEHGIPGLPPDASPNLVDYWLRNWRESLAKNENSHISPESSDKDVVAAAQKAYAGWHGLRLPKQPLVMKRTRTIQPGVEIPTLRRTDTNRLGVLVEEPRPADSLSQGFSAPERKISAYAEQKRTEKQQLEQFINDSWKNADLGKAFDKFKQSNTEGVTVEDVAVAQRIKIGRTIKNTLVGQTLMAATERVKLVPKESTPSVERVPELVTKGRANLIEVIKKQKFEFPKQPGFYMTHQEIVKGVPWLIYQAQEQKTVSPELQATLTQLKKWPERDKQKIEVVNRLPMELVPLVSESHVQAKGDIVTAVIPQDLAYLYQKLYESGRANGRFKFERSALLMGRVYLEAETGKMYTVVYGMTTRSEKEIAKVDDTITTTITTNDFEFIRAQQEELVNRGVTMHEVGFAHTHPDNRAHFASNYDTWIAKHYFFRKFDWNPILTFDENEDQRKVNIAGFGYRTDARGVDKIRALARVSLAKVKLPGEAWQKSINQTSWGVPALTSVEEFTPVEVIAR